MYYRFLTAYKKKCPTERKSIFKQEQRRAIEKYIDSAYLCTLGLPHIVLVYSKYMHEGTAAIRQRLFGFYDFRPSEPVVSCVYLCNRACTSKLSRSLLIYTDYSFL